MMRAAWSMAPVDNMSPVKTISALLVSLAPPFHSRLPPLRSHVAGAPSSHNSDAVPRADHTPTRVARVLLQRGNGTGHARTNRPGDATSQSARPVEVGTGGKLLPPVGSFCRAEPYKVRHGCD